MFGKNNGPSGYNKVDTIIGEGTELKGTVQSNGVVRIDGFLEGSIAHAGELIVGPKGRLIATVKAKTMAIAGDVRGELVIEGRLELLSTARLVGNIQCGHLIVHEGAMFQGRSNMAADPKVEAAASTAS